MGDLTSFPTRRSSDLGIERTARAPGVVHDLDVVGLLMVEDVVEPGESPEDEQDVAGFDYILDHQQAYNIDRKSTRLNSSHTVISYAVFCLKKKKTTHHREAQRNAPQKAHTAVAHDQKCGLRRLGQFYQQHRQLPRA